MAINKTRTGETIMHTPQTVTFSMRVHYNRIERPADKPMTVDLVFHSFEKMIRRYYKETHRRAYADRATSAEYRMNLTDHGRQVCADDAYRAEAHAAAINGTWFSM